MFGGDFSNYHNNQRQGEQGEHNQLVVQKKKQSLLKRKKLPSSKIYSNIDLKHVINIGDICFMNEDALRNPDTSEETLLKSLYHYNSITKVTLNNSFISIDLKKNCESILPPQYFFERLRSFGDQQMADMASSLEKIHSQFCTIKNSTPDNEQTFTMNSEEILLTKFLQSRGNRKYFLYFSEISSDKITMKNIIFSVPLLQALGCNIKNIGLDFLKQRHVFFEVFTAKNYGNVLQGCFQRFSKLQAYLMLNPNLTDEQRRELTEMIYFDEVIRKKQGKEGIYEQISRAKVMWYSPHPCISYFEILELDEAVGLVTSKKHKKCLFEETKPEQEIQMLRKIGIDDTLIKIEDGYNQKHLCDTLNQ